MEIPRHWRLKAQRYRLEGSVCPTCGGLSFPPRPVCHRCADQKVRILSDADSEAHVGNCFIKSPALLAPQFNCETNEPAEKISDQIWRIG